jgi:hypothetical protein
MAKNSLETACENYFKELLRAHRALKGITLRNSDSAQAAEVNCLVVQAVQGEDLLEGPRGLDGQKRCAVEVMIEYRSTGDPQRNDIVRSAVPEAIKNAGNVRTKAQKQFGQILILDEDMTSDRDTTKSLRTTTWKVPIEAGYVG